MGRKLAFVLASSKHGAMIVNRFDYHMVDAERGYGVGFQILETAEFDQSEVDMALQLLNLRRRHHGDGVVAIDCGANIGVHTVEWAVAMTVTPACRRSPGARLLRAGRQYRDQQLLQCLCAARRGFVRARHHDHP